ncbi:MFS transporter [Micromonospora haikouensis]|uniref:MFS transporter n=1 Tax=Micromonospora haikouensis TaxID=686309 RepID=UPI003D730789
MTAKNRLPRAVHYLLGLELISALGSGLVLPFTAIYLYEVRDQPTGKIGLLMALMAVVGLGGSVLGGHIEKKIGFRQLAQLGLVIQGLGFLLIGQMSTLPTLAFAFAVTGLGTGLANPMLGVLLARLTPASQHSQAFAASHWVLNLGVGGGALLGGLLVADLNKEHFAWIYLLNGISFVVLAAGLLPLRVANPMEDPKSATEDRPSPAGGYFALLAQPLLLLVLAVQLSSEALGFAQVDSSVTLLLHNLAFSPTAIGMLIGANTVAVILLQIPISRWARQVPRHRLLMIQCGTWLVGYAVAAVATIWLSALSVVLLVAFFVLVAVGECLYSSALMPLVNEIAHKEQLGKAFALLSTVSNISKLSGPALGLLLVGSAQPLSLWGLMAFGALVGLVSAAWAGVLIRRTPGNDSGGPQDSQLEMAG